MIECDTITAEIDSDKDLALMLKEINKQGDKLMSLLPIYPAEMLVRFGAKGPALVVDVKPAETLARALRNIPGTHCLPSGRLTARDVMFAKRVIATKAAVERLQEVLGS